MPGLSSFLHRRRAVALTALIVAGCLMAGPQSLAAQPGEQARLEELRSDVLELFDVVPLRDGALLEPRSGSVDVRAVEISGGEMLLDGESVDEDELLGRVGLPEADLILQLAEMDGADMRELLSSREAAETVIARVEVTLDDEVVAEVVAEVAAEVIEPPRAPRAPRAERSKRHRRDSQVVVGDTLVVEEDEIVEEVTVFGDDVEVYGEVVDNAVAIGGSVTVEGTVGGDVSAVGGSVYLGENAVVEGDAVSVGGSVEREPGARVHGEIVEVPFAPNFRIGGWPMGGSWHGSNWRPDVDFSPFGMVTHFAWGFFGFVILALLVCLVVLLARTPLERVTRRVELEPWKAGLVGLVAQVMFVPLLVMLVVILAVSIIGIPLLLLVPFAILALVLVCFLGYVAVAYKVGEFLEERFAWNLQNPYLRAVVGVAVIQAFSLIGDALDFGWGPVWFFGAMFTVLGVLVEYVAWTVGFGAALLARFGTAEGWRGRGGDNHAIPDQGQGSMGAIDKLNPPDGGRLDWDEEIPEVPEVPDFPGDPVDLPPVDEPGEDERS